MEELIYDVYPDNQKEFGECPNCGEDIEDCECE